MDEWDFIVFEKYIGFCRCWGGDGMYDGLEWWMVNDISVSDEEVFVSDDDIDVMFV